MPQNSANGTASGAQPARGSLPRREQEPTDQEQRERTQPGVRRHHPERVPEPPLTIPPICDTLPACVTPSSWPIVRNQIR